MFSNFFKIKSLKTYKVVNNQPKAISAKPLQTQLTSESQDHEKPKQYQI